jgi:hypothetical protein
MTGKKKIECGDFQRPRNLADSVVAFLPMAGISPSLIVEPTCASWSFVSAAMTRGEVNKHLRDAALADLVISERI